MKLVASIFDMDGLLINSERLALDAFQSTCAHFGMTESFALYEKLLGTNQTLSKKILNQELAAHIDREEFEAFWEVLYVESTKDGVPLMKGVHTMLDFLDQHALPAAVATSTKTEHAIEKLDKAGILHRFVSVTGGDQVSNGKPAPDIYLKSAKTLDAEPQHCVALEDSPNGIKSAVTAGLHAIQIPDLIQPDEQLLRLGHKVFTDLELATGYLKQLHKQA